MQNEKTSATTGQPGQPQQGRKPDAPAVARTDASPPMATKPKSKDELRAEEQALKELEEKQSLEKLREDVRAMMKEYYEADAALLALDQKIIEAKRARSKVVERITQRSPNKKSFNYNGKIHTVMSRIDSHEKSPTFGERFHYFRTPGKPDPLEL
jgi:hypothetical protein